MAYTTAQKVASLINISATAILSDWIEWAQGLIELRTGIKYEEIAVQDELYDGSGNEELILKNFPITEVTKVEYFDEDNSEEWEELDSDYYKVYLDEGRIKFYDPDGDILDVTCFEEGMQNWRINYKHGYTTTPTEIELLATLIVADLYYKSVNHPSVVSSEHIGDYSVGYDNKSSIPIPEIIEKIFSQIGFTKTFIRGI